MNYFVTFRPNCSLRNNYMLVRGTSLTEVQNLLLREYPLAVNTILTEQQFATIAKMYSLSNSRVSYGAQCTLFKTNKENQITHMVQAIYPVSMYPVVVEELPPKPEYKPCPEHTPAFTLDDIKDIITKALPQEDLELKHALFEINSRLNSLDKKTYPKHLLQKELDRILKDLARIPKEKCCDELKELLDEILRKLGNYQPKPDKPTPQPQPEPEPEPEQPEEEFDNVPSNDPNNIIDYSDLDLYSPPTDSLMFHDAILNSGENERYTVDIRGDYGSSPNAPTVQFNIKNLQGNRVPIRDVRVMTHSFLDDKLTKMDIPVDNNALPTNGKIYNNILFSISAHDAYAREANFADTRMSINTDRLSAQIGGYAYLEKKNHWSWMNEHNNDWYCTFFHIAVRYADRNVWYVHPYIIHNPSSLREEKIPEVKTLYESTVYYRKDLKFWLDGNQDVLPIYVRSTGQLLSDWYHRNVILNNKHINPAYKNRWMNIWMAGYGTPFTLGGQYLKQFMDDSLQFDHSTKTVNLGYRTFYGETNYTETEDNLMPIVMYEFKVDRRNWGEMRVNALMANYENREGMLDFWIELRKEENSLYTSPITTLTHQLPKNTFKNYVFEVPKEHVGKFTSLRFYVKPQKVNFGRNAFMFTDIKLQGKLTSTTNVIPEPKETKVEESPLPSILPSSGANTESSPDILTSEIY